MTTGINASFPNGKRAVGPESAIRETRSEIAVNTIPMRAYTPSSRITWDCEIQPQNAASTANAVATTSEYRRAMRSRVALSSLVPMNSKPPVRFDIPSRRNTSNDAQARDQWTNCAARSRKSSALMSNSSEKDTSGLPLAPNSSGRAMKAVRNPRALAARMSYL